MTAPKPGLRAYYAALDRDHPAVPHRHRTHAILWTLIIIMLAGVLS